MMYLFLLVPPVIAAGLAFVVRPYRSIVGWLNALLSLGPLGAALAFANHTLQGGEATTFGPGDLLRADSLSALLMVCVSAASTLTLILGPGMAPRSQYDGAQLRRYHMFVALFIFGMLLAVSANNVGVMWIAIEATTVFTALLIPLTQSRSSIEASWKYILISSVGIALAFAGTVLGYFDFVTVSGHGENSLNWSTLRATAPGLRPEVMRLAFVFLIVGYGTKAGIAPMHTWKPDAYGESPAPLGALMSSGLFAVTIYAILRWKTITDAAVGPGFTDVVLLALGLLSVLIASFSLVLIRNYKRMLAYSSIEHAGLICLGLGLGPLGAFAALLHLINHTIAKSLLFLLAGSVELRYGSLFIRDVRGLLRAMPWTGFLFAFTMFMLIGLPPGGFFVSEYALFRAGFKLHHPWLMAGVLFPLAVAFVAFMYHLSRMLFGAVPDRISIGESSAWRIVPLFVGATTLVVLGLILPSPLLALLHQVVAIVTPS